MKPFAEFVTTICYGLAIPAQLLWDKINITAQFAVYLTWSVIGLKY